MKLLCALAEASAYSAALYLAVLLIVAAFRRKLSPALRFALWLLVAARLCVPVTLESGFHPFTLPQEAADAASPSELTTMLDEREIFYREPNVIPNNGAASPAAPDAASVQAEAEPDTAAPAVAPKFAPTWADALVTLWLLGAATLTMKLALTAIRLRRAIRRNGLLPDERTRGVYADCAAQLGIRRAPEIRLLASASSPALTVGLRPRVILPVDLSERFSDEQLRFALLHELTHFRRRDHLACLLLRGLEAIYWFNPVVWLTGKSMLREMEAACDGAVARALNGAKKRAYALTLLSLLAQSRRESYVLGMALSLAERDAERRIRGVFAPAKSGLPVKIAALLAALLLAFSCFTTACQPTPEAEIIVNKGDDTLGEAVKNTPQTTLPGTAEPITPVEDVTAQLRASLGAPEHWTYSGQSADGKLNIIADAAVTVPNALRLPVANAELREFTQQDIDRVMEVLFGNELTWYDGNTKTKEWIEERILILQEASAKLDPNEQDYETNKAWQAAEIAQLKKQYQDAPYEADLAVLEPVIRTLTDETKVQYEGVSLRGQVGGEEWLFQCGSSYANMLSIHAGMEWDDYIDVYFGVYAKEPYEVALTEDEAVRQASAIAAALTDELTLTLVAPAATFAQNGKNSSWAWACVFTRAVNGVGTLYTCEDVGSDIMSEVNDPIQYEKMIIVIGDEGLREFRWSNPMKVTSIENDNVALLSFEQATARALAQAEIYYSYNANQDPGTTVTFTRAELGLMRVLKQDGAGYYYLPVWNFYAQLTHTQAFMDEYYGGQMHLPDQIDEYGNPECFVDGFPQNYGSITINAIDGSVVDKDLGY